jgi:hypothetical protein
MVGPLAAAQDSAPILVQQNVGGKIAGDIWTVPLVDIKSVRAFGRGRR